MKLFLFDIDGTLIRSGGVGKESMSLAFEKIYGISNGFHDIEMMGRTDPAILNEALAGHSICWDDNRVERFKDVYYCILETTIQKPRSGKQLCPGILSLLSELKEKKDAVAGLLTGNWKRSAIIKLRYFGIDHYFELGAFADDSSIREELVPFALSRFKDKYNVGIIPDHVFVIGDTPKDILCAKPHGVRTVVVATGFHSVDELKQEGPDYIFEDFRDTHAVLKILQ